jgi:predicted esterase
MALSGGKGMIWLSLPFLNESGTAAVTWWGDAPRHRPHSTVAFLKQVVPALCERFSGDAQRVILCGFSRGAIAANVIGLHDDDIARLWRRFVCFSHYDGVNPRWPFSGADAASARQRLARLRGRPQLICQETEPEATRRYLATTGVTGDFTFLATGFRNHNDAWVLRPSDSREKARTWLTRVLEKSASMDEK